MICSLSAPTVHFTEVNLSFDQILLSFAYFIQLRLRVSEIRVYMVNYLLRFIILKYLRPTQNLAQLEDNRVNCIS